MTEEDRIKDYLYNVIYSGKNKNGKSRKREYIDPRNYLIALMFYKYRFTEEKIAHIVRRDRTSVNYAKKQPYYNRNREDFLRNTYDVRNKFPYIFQDPEKIEQENNVHKHIRIQVCVDKFMLEKLDKYRKENKLFDVGSALVELTKKQLSNEQR